MKNKDFSKVITQMANDPRTSNHDLHDLLIMPIQRCPRYLLLLQELIKYTPHVHPDYKDLQQAKNALMNVTEILNESERASSNMQQLHSIQQEMRDYPVIPLFPSTPPHLPF